MTARSTPVPPAMPFTTSWTVPSPPTATSSSAPSSAAWRASSVSCPGRSDSMTSPFSPAAAARLAISGHCRPVAPFSEAGLTRKTVRAVLMLRLLGRGRQGDPCHPVDGGLELLVRDPLELTLDDDVAHGQQAAGLDPAEGTEREEHGRLHLDRQHPAR